MEQIVEISQRSSQEFEYWDHMEKYAYASGRVAAQAGEMTSYVTGCLSPEALSALPQTGREFLRDVYVTRPTLTMLRDCFGHVSTYRALEFLAQSWADAIAAGAVRLEKAAMFFPIPVPNKEHKEPIEVVVVGCCATDGDKKPYVAPYLRCSSSQRYSGKLGMKGRKMWQEDTSKPLSLAGIMDTGGLDDACADLSGLVGGAHWTSRPGYGHHRTRAFRHTLDLALAIAGDRKRIAVSDDGQRLAFNTGLMTPEGHDIFMCLRVPEEGTGACCTFGFKWKYDRCVVPALEFAGGEGWFNPEIFANPFAARCSVEHDEVALRSGKLIRKYFRCLPDAMVRQACAADPVAEGLQAACAGTHGPACDEAADELEAYVGSDGEEVLARMDSLFSEAAADSLARARSDKRLILHQQRVGYGSPAMLVPLWFNGKMGDEALVAIVTSVRMKCIAVVSLTRRFWDIQATMGDEVPDWLLRLALPQVPAVAKPQPRRGVAGLADRLTSHTAVSWLVAKTRIIPLIS